MTFKKTLPEVEQSANHQNHVITKHLHVYMGEKWQIMIKELTSSGVCPLLQLQMIQACIKAK